MTRLDAQRWPARWAGEPFLYRTTIGRRTGRRHRIEIWIAGHDGRLYLMSGGRDRGDWVRNLKLNQRVTVELGNETYEGCSASHSAGFRRRSRARDLLVAKYADTEDDLEEWAS